MAMSLLIEIGAQLRGIDQIAVVRKADAIGRVDIERLAFSALVDQIGKLKLK